MAYGRGANKVIGAVQDHIRLVQRAPNRLQQDFTAQRLNQKWLADIVQIRTGEGWLRLAVVLDAYSRRDCGLVNEAEGGQPVSKSRSENGFGMAAYRPRLGPS